MATRDTEYLRTQANDAFNRGDMAAFLRFDRMVVTRTVAQDAQDMLDRDIIQDIEAFMSVHAPQMG